MYKSILTQDYISSSCQLKVTSGRKTRSGMTLTTGTVWAESMNRKQFIMVVFLNKRLKYLTVALP